MKKNKLSEKQINVVLDSLRELVEQGPWHKSAFLRVIGKKLQKIQDNFIERVGGARQHTALQSLAQHAQPARGTTQKEIFIGLYSSDGTNLQSWEQILQNLPRQAISRPVYAKEADIQKIVKEKKNRINEGYVVMYVNQQAILPTPLDKTPKDKFGTVLLTLRDKALSLDNIVRFVHATGVYAYRKGRLIQDASHTS